MAEWKTQMTFNYNPPYHSYAHAYRFMYQPGPEQSNPDPGGWNEVGEESGYCNPAGPQGYFAAHARARGDSPEQQQPGSGHFYQGVAGVPPVCSESAGGCARRTGSDSASDSEAHTSPDSWSSGSSREGNHPQTTSAIWAGKGNQQHEGEAAAIRNTNDNEDVSSSHIDESQPLAVASAGDADRSSLDEDLGDLKKVTSGNERIPQPKMRAAFSQSQMDTLIHRFSIQRYLTPAEMKHLGEVTGLTYKQVKTWFQNRRMKLRRHQKDSGWVSERYSLKDTYPQGPVYSNVPQHNSPISQYQQDGGPQMRDYNQHRMGPGYKKTPPNLAFYLAMGSSAASPTYPHWSPGSSQAATVAPNKPQMTGWSMPPNFDYNPVAFNAISVATVNNYGHNGSFDSKDGELTALGAVVRQNSSGQ